MPDSTIFSSILVARSASSACGPVTRSRARSKPAQGPLAVGHHRQVHGPSGETAGGAELGQGLGPVPGPVRGDTHGLPDHTHPRRELAGGLGVLVGLLRVLGQAGRDELPGHRLGQVAGQRAQLRPRLRVELVRGNARRYVGKRSGLARRAAGPRSARPGCVPALAAVPGPARPATGPGAVPARTGPAAGPVRAGSRRTVVRRGAPRPAGTRRHHGSPTVRGCRRRHIRDAPARPHGHGAARRTGAGRRDGCRDRGPPRTRCHAHRPGPGPARHSGGRPPGHRGRPPGHGPAHGRPRHTNARRG